LVLARFAYTGTRDYTAFLSLPAALSFVETELGGMAAMQRYNRDLLLAGSTLLVDSWESFFVVIKLKDYSFRLLVLIFIYPPPFVCFLFLFNCLLCVGLDKQRNDWLLHRNSCE
jgi:hypothetical protein